MKNLKYFWIFNYFYFSQIL